MSYQKINELRLGTKLQAVLGIGFALVAVLIISFQLSESVKNIRSERYNSNLRIAQVMSGPVSSALTAIDRETVVYGFMEVFTHDDRAAGLAIVMNGELIKHQESLAYDDFPVDLLKSIALDSERLISTVVQNKNGYQIIAVPVSDSASRPLGALAIGWSMRDILSTVLRAALLEAAILIAICGLLLGALSYLVRRFVTGPLCEIAGVVDQAEGLKEVNKTNRFVGHHEKRGDEIGTLARAVTKLQRHTVDLKLTNEALASAELTLKKRSDQLVEAQRLGKLGDWSWRLGDSEVHLAPELYDLLGYDPATFRPTRDAVLSACLEEGARRVLEAQAEIIRTGMVKSVDVKAKRGDGSVGDYMLTIKASTDADGQVSGFSGTIQDISERKIAEEQLAKLAYYDPLTGLANRALFHREMNDVLTRCSRTGGHGALLLLDLDRFKEVNDSLGHGAGDELLGKVGHLIGQVLDSRRFLARLGGDEFAVILPDCGDQAAIERLAGEVIAVASGSIALERGEVVIGTSIGIVRFPRDGTNSSELLRNADLALYRAKEDGRGRFAFFEPDMNATVQHKIALARDLRRAVSENAGLAVHYQPQVDLSTGRVTGYEALIRWTHPTLGNVPPSEFIPIAESSSLICDIGLWILREAARQGKAWLDAGEPEREIAVNISAAQIWHSDLIHEVERVLEETDLPPHLLCLELTESLMADDAGDRVRVVLNALKSLGVTLALDDFGTDYSSLGYLIQLPFDKLKIDRVFIDGVAYSTRSRELLKGIIALGRGLGMTVVGEGAEKSKEVEILREFGCDLVQGYVFARPTVAPEALAFARNLETKEYDAGAMTPSAAADVLVARLRSAGA